MIVYPIRSDIPPSFVRAIERQKVTSRARGQWHLPKNRSPFFVAGAVRREPRVHICCSNPGRVDERVAHTHTRMAHTTCVHVLCASAACEPKLTKSGQMSISNVAQVGAACRRKPTQCICASRVCTYIDMNVCRVCVRACPRTRLSQIRSLSDCTCLLVLYRWHCTISS